MPYSTVIYCTRGAYLIVQTSEVYPELTLTLIKFRLTAALLEHYFFIFIRVTLPSTSLFIFFYTYLTSMIRSLDSTTSTLIINLHNRESE